MIVTTALLVFNLTVALVCFVQALDCYRTDGQFGWLWVLCGAVAVNLFFAGYGVVRLVGLAA